ncbi:hypothetical protein [Leeuwenhoekiella marinoflava]|uniref:Auto-transporter adhesin head GIN domain-containing protein n=2 Tax=Leeuwenhoekiella marinoflava TaxID=988 RepID=A0A4Q0PJA6_9FLAO|nr:hypothetical protein [Leeuwenhoekiella marinoflava]RXG27403.1 hypothetical protein DSL99_2928 [Leeuwenhoekiella marinoflava]SHF70041.1 hypothetical protein SAMN02745246_03196 [Leeuwenhoekiella marinoflava DSM 3653]
MKKLHVLVLALALSATNLFANTDPKPASKSVELRAQVVALLGSPNIELEQDILESDIHFMVTTQGNLVVLNVDTENKAVENYIKSRLNYKKTNLKVLRNRFFNLTYTIKKA